MIKFAAKILCMDSRKVAVIDLGTNTFNLLLAKVTPGAYYIYLDEKIPVMIGKGGINRGIIDVPAQKRALNALSHYREIIGREGVEEIYGYATSAFRNARNGEAFRAQLSKITGLPLSIISGDVEAEYIYQGVRSALHIGTRPALIVDIGGGSVEFIIGTSKEILWKRSYEIGAQRLLDLFHRRDPIPAEGIKELDRHLEKHLGDLFEQIGKYQPLTLIGSSGTFDTLSEIHCCRNGLDPVSDDTELPLEIESYLEIHRELLVKNREERLVVPGMLEMRADMIVVASCLIHHLLNRHPFRHMRVSAHSLKEGMLGRIAEMQGGSEAVSVFR
jgi:exopolyphosphatase / guanosine-5'-triphosphate,3'-diphosphate pyrophosphatase